MIAADEYKTRPCVSQTRRLVPYFRVGEDATEEDDENRPAITLLSPWNVR